MEDASTIDVILKKEEDGRAVLCIIDAGITTDPAQRLDCLLKKLKVYVSGIMSGELEDSHPNHTAKDFKIRVVCSTRPAPEMTRISQVCPRGDPANSIPVEYTEFPEGAWSNPVPEVEEQRIEEETSPPNPLLVQAGQKALALAEEYLAAGRKGFCFAVVGTETSSEVVTFCVADATDATFDQAMQYGRELPTGFTVFVTATECRGVKINGKEHDAILLNSFLRGEKFGFATAKPFRRKGIFSGFKTTGPLEFIGPIPNPLSPPE